MRQRRFKHRRLATRRGLTILEVLMAIGVAVIGLFGVLALIPIAGQRAERSLLEDDKSAFGRSAFHDFDVRGMRDPRNWLLQSDTNQPNRFEDVSSLRFVDVPTLYLSPTNTTSTKPGFSFCIDPLLIADRKESATPVAVPFFPAAGPTASPIMLRTSLRSQLNVAPTHALFAMNRQMARSVFETRDDINTSRQDDETRPALQEYSKLDPTDPNSTPYRRLADGSLSWMATVVPANPSFNDSYLLSIVVFHKRDVSADVSEQEAVFDVSGFPGSGFGGGDVVLDSDATELEQNDWVVLAQSGLANKFGWYRVVAADVDGNVTHVTLEGRDWDASIATKCIAVRNVTAVYEKTIRLETTSLWKTN